MTRCASWIELSAARLTANCNALQTTAGEATEVLAVVKADAYGHGADLCIPVLAAAGARWFGVTSALEGARARQALASQQWLGKGAESRILLMSGVLPGDVADTLEHKLTPVVWTTEQVSLLAGTSVQPVHVEVDTAMGREGVTPGAELAGLLDALAAARVPLGGVMTHFASSEVAGSALTQAQERRFEQAVAQVRERGLRPAWVHAGNTSTVDNPAQAAPWLVDLAASVGARAMVRTGLALFGYCLPIEGEAAAHVAPKLQLVMTWKCPVLSARELACGQTVGYNATFTATRPMRVALLPVGYADGFRRELSSRGWAMIDGQRAPILGRVSMNLTVVDVSAIDGVRTGDEAVILGDGITADDHAAMAGTIAYEILCGVRADEMRFAPSPRSGCVIAR